MNIKNLVNKEAVTITNCESEPIHIPGSIQSHGFLMGVKGTDFKIVYCSENCSDFLGCPLPEILGSPLSRFLGDGQLASFTDYFATAEKILARPFIFTYQDKSYTATAFLSNDCTVLELERLSEEAVELPDLYIQTKRFAYYTERADNLKTLCQDIANETRLITGYDRVMIYRFDNNYNGEVFAESKADGLDPFLGLNYPHTDIPVQARELYLRNHIRMLVDVDYIPVPVYALNEGTTEVATLDLSLSGLRSFSPIHIRYLQNMGVAASFSISLIHNHKLWGLIACHHRKPKQLAYYTRLLAHLQGIFLTSQIDVRRIADEFEVVKETERKLNELRNVLTEEESPIEKNKNLLLLKNLLNADGLVLHFKGNFFCQGELPTPDHLYPLIQWLLSTKRGGSFQTSKLIAHYPEAAAFSHSIAGLFYIPLGSNNEHCVIWTLQEVEKTIDWAGNPAKAIDKNEQTNELTPRKSFTLWKESVKFQSREWKNDEKNAALFICSAIQHLLHLKDLIQEEQRYFKLNERLQKSNEELANMNWISTHDLKEPLRKIQLYASIILERQGNEISDSVKTTVGRMQASAGKMQMLIDDLLAYTKVMNDENRLEEVDLNAVLNEVRAELKENLEEKGAVLNVSALPFVKGIGFQLRQLFINLISNSLKFAKADEPAVIVIHCREVFRKNGGAVASENPKLYHCITVSDNGIGFDSAYRHDIFKVFYRLQTGKYKGTGIGLAICRKIAEANGGFIEAESEEGKGASFSIYLPIA